MKRCGHKGIFEAAIGKKGYDCVLPENHREAFHKNRMGETWPTEAYVKGRQEGKIAPPKPGENHRDLLL